MKKAIITGATGLVGTALSKRLIEMNIEVLCLGRKELNSNEVKDIFGQEVTYIKMQMSSLEELYERINKINWFSGDECVFYNLAWAGFEGLTDGPFEVQMNNAAYCANAVKLAKKLKCIKFINAGTLEETYAEQYLNGESNLYVSSQVNYAIAKLASRDLCNMVAYLEKIDYIHTRLSVPLKSDLSIGGYIAKTLLKIANGESYDKPKNNQLFDIIEDNDVANAFYLIGLHGKNKSDYFIGTSVPLTLENYFENFKQVVLGLIPIKNMKIKNLDQGIFDITELKNDTGFLPTTNLINIANKLRN